MSCTDRGLKGSGARLRRLALQILEVRALDRLRLRLDERIGFLVLQATAGAFSDCGRSCAVGRRLLRLRLCRSRIERTGRGGSDLSILCLRRLGAISAALVARRQNRPGAGWPDATR